MQSFLYLSQTFTLHGTQQADCIFGCPETNYNAYLERPKMYIYERKLSLNTPGLCYMT